jgi:hypothetical protein
MNGMIEGWKGLFSRKPRGVFIILTVWVLALLLVAEVSLAAAQFRPLNQARPGAIRQIARQQRAERQAQKKGGNLADRAARPNQMKGIALQNQITPEENERIPRGVPLRQRIAMIRVFRQLDLSEEQKTKLRELTRQFGDQIPVLNRLHQAQNAALDEALYRPNFDPKLVEQRAAEVAATQAELIKAQARVLSQIRQILTPEQTVRFRELLILERNRPLDEPLPQQHPPN